LCKGGHFIADGDRIVDEMERHHSPCSFTQAKIKIQESNTSA
jgi:hypothetical protein